MHAISPIGGELRSGSIHLKYYVQNYLETHLQNALPLHRRTHSSSGIPDFWQAGQQLKSVYYSSCGKLPPMVLIDILRAEIALYAYILTKNVQLTPCMMSLVFLCNNLTLRHAACLRSMRYCGLISLNLRPVGEGGRSPPPPLFR